jgi:hypothetical protein
MAYDIFISYSRQDSPAVDRIVACLTDGGLSCFCDRTGIVGGEEWVAAIREAVRASRICLFVASVTSIASHWTLLELLEARKAPVPIVTLLLSPELAIEGSIQFVIGDRQHVPGHDPDRHLPELLRSLRALVDRRSQPGAYADAEAVANAGTFRSEETGAERGVTLELHPDRPDAIERAGRHWIVRSLADAYHGSALGYVPRMLDCVVSATIEYLQGDHKEWMGFELGALWPGQYHQALVNGRQQVRIARHWGGNRWEHVAQRDDLRLESRESRRLTAVRRADRLHAFVDGLHALTCAMPTGPARIGIVIGRNMTVRFRELDVRGMDVDTPFRLWNQLDTKAAKPWLEQIAASPFGPDDLVRRADGLLAALRAGYPDRGESLLVVVGAGILPQLHEGPLAQQLVLRVAAASHHREFRWARAVTDTALEQSPEFAACPLISLGGPATNRFTAHLAAELPEVSTGEDGVHVHHALEAGGRRVALFGDDAARTVRAVEWFLERRFLERLLAIIWTTS